MSEERSDEALQEIANGMRGNEIFSSLHISVFQAPKHLRGKFFDNIIRTVFPGIELIPEGISPALFFEYMDQMSHYSEGVPVFQTVKWLSQGEFERIKGMLQ